MRRPAVPDLRFRQFGRRPAAIAVRVPPAARLAGELRLFALTFATGFLFMSVYLA